MVGWAMMCMVVTTSVILGLPDGDKLRARLHFPAGILRNPAIPFFQAFEEEL
jgi:hypothetical protein